MYSSEFKLAKKEREREILLRTLPGGFARLDARDYRTILWYDADFLRMIGYTKEQFEKELHSTCEYLHPDDLKRIEHMLKEIEGTEQSIIMEARIITRSGETKILTVTLCYANGEDSWDGIPSFYTVGIDVTKDRREQARQQTALEEAYMAARIANSAKTKFLSSMSHDTRTPLNAIIGMTAIARANLIAPEKVNDCLNKINTSSQYLLSLINEILDMSQIESGKIDLHPEEISLPNLIQNVSDMCRSLLEEKHLEFEVYVGKVLHEKIITDGDRLHQVFMNLLSNGIKYTPPGYNELNREIAFELLSMQGMLIETAENGLDAVQAFRSSNPGYYNAILMDIQMPVMDGYEAAAAIRLLDRDDAKTVPILAMTANAFITDISKAYSVGMNDYITKPIDVNGLNRTLEKWIHKTDNHFL